MTKYYFTCQTLDCPKFCEEKEVPKLTSKWETHPPYNQYYKESVCPSCGEYMQLLIDKVKANGETIKDR